MNIAEIVTVLSELHKITGLRVSLHDADYREIAAYPERSLPFCERIHSLEGEHAMCVECDGEACKAALVRGGSYIYKCRYGLTEAVSPLYNFGTLTGFLMMGQIAESSSALEAALARSSKIIPADEAARLCNSITLVKSDMLASYVKIMTICAQYLTLSNALPSTKPTVAEIAKRYIHENLSKKISIADICRSIGCSKSTLLTAYKKRYGVTVNNYITEERLLLSKKLLERSGSSVNDVAAACGFNDQSYFSKVFSARFGFPPSEYKYVLSSQSDEVVEDQQK